MQQVTRYMITVPDRGVFPTPIQHLNPDGSSPSVFGVSGNGFISIQDITPVAEGGTAIPEGSYFWDTSNLLLYQILSTDQYNMPNCEAGKTEFVFAVNPPITNSFAGYPLEFITSVPNLFISAEAFDANTGSGTFVSTRDNVTGAEILTPFAAGFSGAAGVSPATMRNDFGGGGLAVPVVLDLSNATVDAVAYNTPVIA